MWELSALVVYSVQWLGIVLGVGAEVVLMVAHLTALHEHKPQWLATIPAVRAVQRWGLVLMVVSGVVAAGLQALLDPSVFLIPVFGFKWALIALVWIAFLASRSGGRATVEGLAGGSWLALFVVHSVAPSAATWAVLGAGYAVWLAAFGLLWASTVYVMGRSVVRTAAITPAVAPAPVHAVPQQVAIVPPKPPVVTKPAPVRAAPPLPPPVAPAPVIKPAVPPVVPAPAPKPIPPPVVVIPHTQPAVASVALPVEKKIVAAVVQPATPRISLWKRFLALFTRAPKKTTAPASLLKPIPTTALVAPPLMAAVSAPVHYAPASVAPRLAVARPSVAARPAAPAAPIVSEKPHPNLPVIEHLELLPPAPTAAAASAPSEAAYTPDWNDLPGLRIMPQKPEDLSKQNRAPLVQAA